MLTAPGKLSTARLKKILDGMPPFPGDTVTVVRQPPDNPTELIRVTGFDNKKSEKVAWAHDLTLRILWEMEHS